MKLRKVYDFDISLDKKYDMRYTKSSKLSANDVRGGK